MIITQPPPSEPPVFVNASNGAPCVVDGRVNVTSTVAQATIESYGPTGSGADNIWTALDSVPAGVSWIALRIAFALQHTGTFTALTYNGRKNGSTASLIAPNIETELLYARMEANSQPYDGTVLAFVPVDSNRMFQVRWDKSPAGASNAISQIIVGYGINGSL